MHQVFETPIGAFFLETSEDGIVQSGIGERPPVVPAQTSDAADAHLKKAVKAVEHYFSHERETFDDLVLAPRGSPFQLAVWAELSKIPYGTTTSYGEIAERVGQPDGAQAVGRANNQNPLGVIVPCHRVIGADGSMVGFGGGIEMKTWLLRHEGALLL